MIAKSLQQNQELDRRRQQRRPRKATAVAPPTQGELDAAAEERAENKAASRVPRKLAETPEWAILPKRKKKYATSAERRAATQAKYQAKVNRNPKKKAAHRDAERERQRVWVAEKRAEVREAKRVQLEADQLARYLVWLKCWAVAGIYHGWRLSRQRRWVSSPKELLQNVY